MNIAIDSNKSKLLNALLSLQTHSEQAQLTAIAKQQSHQHCVLCGPSSMLGLKLNFYSDTQQQVWALFKTSHLQQGYTGILHGGFICALLDAGMCQSLFNQGIEAVTADMNVRFLHEIPINSEIVISAKVNSKTPPLYKVEAQLYVDKQLMAKANARFFKKNSNRG